MEDKFKGKSEDTFKDKLTKEEYDVLRCGGTEPAFSDPKKFLYNKNKGMYICAACGNQLFSSDKKFDSGSGWPSFWNSVDDKKVELKKDNSFGMSRTEVVCSKCRSHLGHLFMDSHGKTPTGKRYCINSLALNFEEVDKIKKDLKNKNY